MEMTMKRSDLLQIWGALESLSSLRSKAKFTYAIAKNKRLIEPHFEV